MHIVHLSHPKLTIDELSIHSDQFWCGYGTGRSGINEFLALLEGKLSSAQAETLSLPKNPAIISFSTQQDIYEEEIRKDDSDFLDRPDPGTLAHEFLPTESLGSELIDAFDMRKTLYTGYRQLSSGQGRKLLLLQAILNGSTTIILDSPYDGLDQLACHELDRAFSQLSDQGLRLIILVRNIEDIPSWCDTLAVFRNNSLSHQGRPSEILPLAIKMGATAASIFQASSLSTLENDQRSTLPLELVLLKDGFAGYGEKTLFSGLNLKITQGQHTLVTGPNGCGKSTLLHIITGDNPKCYANNLHMFGIRRGTGESIWSLKKHMGIVSPEIHRNYRVPGTALHVLLSGFYDSIGLYQHVTAQQKSAAVKWLTAIDMAEHSSTPFRTLSYGDQRLILIARALIKQPPLLILDEPTHGLDSGSRKALLDFLETVSRSGRTTLLYVSHRQDEYRSFFQQHLKLENYRQAPADH